MEQFIEANWFTTKEINKEENWWEVKNSLSSKALRWCWWWCCWDPECEAKAQKQLYMGITIRVIAFLITRIICSCIQHFIQKYRKKNPWFGKSLLWWFLYAFIIFIAFILYLVLFNKTAHSL